jgi:hypothetical protein
MSMQFGSVASVRAAAVIAALAFGCDDNAMQSNPVGAGGVSASGGASGVGTAGVSGVGATAGVGAGGMPGMAGTGMAGTGTSGTGVAGTSMTGGSSGMDGMAGMTGGSSGMDGMAGMTGGSSGMAGGEPTSGACMAADSVDADGPFTPTHIQNGGASGSSWVFYPMELGMGGMKHPIFNWGPGAGTGPSNYTDHLNRLASHGFVVISQPSSGSGTTEIASLEWLLEENDMQGSDFYQKLDPERVGAGGHSLGSLTTEAMADFEPLNLYVLVCGGCMGGRGGCGAADIHGPTVILGGSNDIGTEPYNAVYEEITSPVVFLIKEGVGHIDCARANLSPWVAFMRWHWCGETEWAPQFMSGGEYCTSPWECQSKGL